MSFVPGARIKPPADPANARERLPQRTLAPKRVISFGMQTLASVLLRARLDEINAQPKLFHRELLTTYR